jgi:hypothetical protein
MSVEAFLELTSSAPEREALCALLNSQLPKEIGGHGQNEKPSLKLTQDYRWLGGSALAKFDENMSVPGE